MWIKLLMGTALGLMLVLVPDCSRVQEPWVPNPDQFKMERSRSPQLHEALRLRLAETQRDR